MQEHYCGCDIAHDKDCESSDVREKENWLFSWARAQDARAGTLPANRWAMESEMDDMTSDFVRGYY